MTREKNAYLYTRISEKDKERIERLCDAEYLTTGAYVRSTILKDLARRGF